MLPEDDMVRLGHMLGVTREALLFMDGRVREDLWQDAQLARAVSASLMILGEAANNVSAATQAACPDIPWSDIIGMRHKLIHAYFDLNLNIVWKTTHEDLPVLLPQLEELLRQQGGEPHPVGVA